jgi:crotonobetainyl-CoA:carnitine CoA-transferase CaiB-like acyl-CoA transferase
MRPDLSPGESLTGLHAAFGVLLALVDRLRSGEAKGQVVDIGILEAVFNMMEAVVSEYDRYWKIREPPDSVDPKARNETSWTFYRQEMERRFEGAE